MIHLKNSAIGHIPKCAGRFVRACVVKGVDSIVLDIPNEHFAHLTPDLPIRMCSNSQLVVVIWVYCFLRGTHIQGFEAFMHIERVKTGIGTIDTN